MNEDVFHLGIKAIIQNKQGRILLLKVSVAQLKGYCGEAYWDIPGGRIKLGDGVEATLQREVEEETGIKEIFDTVRLDTVLSNNVRIPNPNGGSFGLILSAYRCSVKSEEIKISEEHTEFGWFEPVEAAKLLEFKYPKEFTEKIARLN